MTNSDRLMTTYSVMSTIVFFIVLIVSWISTGIFSITYSGLVLIQAVMSLGVSLLAVNNLSNTKLYSFNRFMPSYTSTLFWGAIIAGLLYIYGMPSTWIVYVLSLPFSMLSIHLFKREKRNRGIK